jgi:hypothetical protein
MPRLRHREIVAESHGSYGKIPSRRAPIMNQQNGEEALPAPLEGREVRRTRQREHAAAAFVLVAFTLFLYRPIFSHRTYSMVASHMFVEYPWAALVHPNPEIKGAGYPQTDNAETFYPLYVWATNTLRSGEFPMWMAYSFGGFPLIELGVHGLFYPPRLLVMPWLDAAAQHDVLLIIHLLLAGFGMYAFCRTIGLAPIASVLAATIWQANGHNAFWFVFEHVAFATAWLPWALLTATLAVWRNSLGYALLCGLTVGMSLLTGSIQVVYAGGLLLAVWYGGLAVDRAWRLRRERRAALRIAVLPLISLTIALSLSAALWLPLAGKISTIQREPFSLALQTGENERLQPRALINALFFPKSAQGLAGLREIEVFVFVGGPALVLALSGLFRRSKIVVFAACLAVFSLALALGFKPLLILMRHLPLFGAIHIFHGAYLFGFALAILAAVQMSALEDLSRSHRQLLRPLILALLAVNCSQLLILFWRVNPVQPRDREWLFPETPAIRAAEGAQDSYHFLPLYYHLPGDAWFPPVMAGKVAAIFALRSDSGYESLLPVYIAGLWRTIEEGGTPATQLPPSYRPYFFHDRLPLALLEKVSVGILMGPPNVQPVGIDDAHPIATGRIQRIYSGPDAWVYKLTRALPRAFLVSTAVSAPDAPDALRLFFDPSLDAHQTAVFIGPVPPGLNRQNSSGTVRIVDDRQNSVRLISDAQAPKVLVLQDSWDDDWKASVDGKPSTVYRVNYAFRGVVVPAGHHRVDFTYRPFLVVVGVIISLVCLACVILFAGLSLKSSRVRSSGESFGVGNPEV